MNLDNESIPRILFKVIFIFKVIKFLYQPQTTTASLAILGLEKVFGRGRLSPYPFLQFSVIFLA
jgi:hypothetical protein